VALKENKNPPEWGKNFVKVRENSDLEKFSDVKERDE